MGARSHTTSAVTGTGRRIDLARLVARCGNRGSRAGSPRPLCLGRSHQSRNRDRSSTQEHRFGCQIRSKPPLIRQWIVRDEMLVSGLRRMKPLEAPRLIGLAKDKVSRHFIINGLTMGV
eukprot:16445923-Heterocapsa_arctica.AAC.2